MHARLGWQQTVQKILASLQMFTIPVLRDKKNWNFEVEPENTYLSVQNVLLMFMLVAL